MRRRFGRGRRGRSGGDAKNPPIDAAQSMQQLVASGVTPVDSLTVVENEELPRHFAVIGEGTDPDGNSLLVGYSPTSGGDAALAVIAEAERRKADGFSGDAFAVAPQWSTAARGQLQWLSPSGIRLRPIGVSSLGDGVVDPASGSSAPLVPTHQLASALVRGEDRELFNRALAAFEGLAAKHGGAVRGGGAHAELVLMARPRARLEVDASSGRIALETLLPERSSSTLDAASLATAMDRLEGQLRRRLNDRRVRGGEEGMRATQVANLGLAAGLRGVLAWPLGGSDPDVGDLVGGGADGRPAVGAVRERFALPDLGAVLGALAELQRSWPVLLGHVDAPLHFGPPQLVLAAAAFDDTALHALSALSIDVLLFDLRTQRGRDAELVVRSATPATPATPATTATTTTAPEETDASAASERSERSRGRSSGGRGRGGQRDRDARRRDTEGNQAPESGGAEVDGNVGEARDGEGGRGRGRRRGGRGRGRNRDEPARAGDSTRAGDRTGEGSDAAPAQRFEEISLFDLDDDTSDGEGGGRGRRRRGRGRRQRRPTDSDDTDRGASSTDAPDAVDPLAAVTDEPTLDNDATEPGEDGVEVEDFDDAIVPLAEGAPDPDERPEPVYEEDDDGTPLGVPKAPDEPVAVVEEEAPKTRPRRRAAIVAHADRGSVTAAILLARDLRLLEGFWIYPQNELMTFFRGVATDLNDQTPIYVVGFSGSRETLQAASLYSGRIDWFDHHDWPPEDLGALRAAIGEDHVRIHPGLMSSLPMVLSENTRRSRFTDKLVELQMGRFTDHDYERWGHVWWHRLGEIAGRTGERRADIEPLLVGRPSDLARDAKLAPSPPPPIEVQYISSRDFRIVHFGGYTLVVVPTPPEQDVCLAARVARERYEASISVAYVEGGETLVLGSDESRGNRSLNLKSMVEYVATKYDWVDALPDEDRVASMHVRDLASQPDRLDEVIQAIGMGRSVLET